MIVDKVVAALVVRDTVVAKPSPFTSLAPMYLAKRGPISYPPECPTRLPAMTRSARLWWLTKTSG